jgi:hypothetical protein
VIRLAARAGVALVTGFFIALFVEMALDEMGLGWGEAVVTPTLALIVGGTGLMWYVLGRTGPFKGR